MLASLAFIVGIVSGIAVWALASRDLPAVIDPWGPPTVAAWWTLSLGVASVVAVIIGSGWVLGTPPSELSWLLASIALAVAALVVGAATLMRGDRHWPTWAGLVLGGLPALLWVGFLIANLLGREA